MVPRGGICIQRSRLTLPKESWSLVPEKYKDPPDPKIQAIF